MAGYSGVVDSLPRLGTGFSNATTCKEVWSISFTGLPLVEPDTLQNVSGTLGHTALNVPYPTTAVPVSTLDE